MFSKKRIYLDHASATLIDPRVARAVARAQEAFPGNPSASHEEGRNAHHAVEVARTCIARSLAVKSEELLFTSGGTESNNIAIRGLIEAMRIRGATYQELHIITTTIEHSSILETVKAVEKEGVRVSYVDPETDGIVRPENMVKLVRPETVLITLAHVNSEIGTIQPLADIFPLLQKNKQASTLSRFVSETKFPVIHADAAQSPLYLDAAPHVLRAQLVSYDAQKLGGPKGAGLLYRDFSVPLSPIYGGGAQERSLRPGTQNVPAIVGTGLAFQLAKEGREKRKESVAALRDYLVALVKERIPTSKLIGSSTRRIANNAHFVIPGVSGDYLSVLMDTEGIAVSPRSACGGSGASVSHVVLAITKSKEDAGSTIRFSLGMATTRRDCEAAVAALQKSVAIASSPRSRDLP